MIIKREIKEYVVIFFGIFLFLSDLNNVWAIDNEDYPVINSNNILSSAYLSSTYHRVDSVIAQNDFYQFNIESDLGNYAISSLALLKKRVNEIKTLGQAINRFEQDNNDFTGELRSELSVTGDSAMDILTAPFSTASKLAGQLSDNLEGTFAGENPYLDNYSNENPYREPRDPTTAAHKRNIAFQLGLDLYSSNPKVQSFLNSVANARAAGRVSAGIGLSNAFSQATSELDTKISLAIKNKSLSELMDYNKQLLIDIRVRAEIAEAYINHPVLSPTSKTTILMYLHQIKKVNKLGSFIEMTLTTKNEVMASVFERMSKMLVRYYNDVEKFSVFVNFKGLPAVITDSRRIVFFDHADLFIWSTERESQYSDSSKHAEKTGYAGWDLVLLGTITPLARQKISQLGYVAYSNFLSEF